MKITKEEILHLANLSRLTLTDEEIENLNMEGIIEFANELGKLDINDVAPTNHILDINNAFREDVIKKSYDRDDILKNAPQKQRGCFLVPQIVE
ncbi:MAG: Asp-tRNA(Asn)/Glu-tRNA(Gln) amidotransferase subunit GatC [Ruminococcaceae bacterium]|nr:Asp-tRNA(Asn)/Glu-tRNA(Gln) amidotransferase subunit GatC [Oscillospiraceae bacterium]